MHELTRGANCPAPSATVTVSVACASAVDVSALLVTEAGKVRSDEDFVFYNNPTGPGVTYLPASSAPRGVDAVRVDTGSVPSGIEKVVVTASLDGSGPETFASAGSMVVTVLDGDLVDQVRFDITGLATEKALICVEVYLRGGAWKVRAVGQGYDTGLAGIATDFGITVEEEPPAAPPPVLAPPVLAPPTGSPAAFAPPVGAPVQAAPPAAKVNLDKGRVSLTKQSPTVSLVKTGAPPLSAIAMGLGWDPAPGKRAIDLDASVIAFDAAGKDLEMVWFMHKQAFGGAIRHSGDNLTGKGEGDDEVINLDLSKLPANVTTLLFTVTSYGGQKFTSIARAYCRLLEMPRGDELVRFELTDTQASTGVLMCKLVRQGDGTWSMTSLGAFHDGKTVKKLLGPARAAL